MDQTKSIKLQKKRLESAEERRAGLTKQMRGQSETQNGNGRTKKNEARKKECNRQVQTNIKSQDVIVVIIYLFIYFPSFSFGLA